MKRLERCCCACTLREGCIIIGAMCAVLALLEAAYNGFLSYKQEDLGKGKYEDFVVTTRYVDWAVQAVNFVISLLLVYGTVKEKPLILRIWVWYTAVMFSLYAVLVIGRSMLYLAFGQTTEAILLAVAFIIAAVVILHIMRVVHSLYCELTERDQPRDISTAAVITKFDL